MCVTIMKTTQGSMWAEARDKEEEAAITGETDKTVDLHYAPEVMEEEESEG